DGTSRTARRAAGAGRGGVMVARPQPVVSPPLPAAADAPRGLGRMIRVGQRVLTLGVCALDAIGRAHLGRVQPDGVELARVASELCGAHGVVLRTRGALPPGPAVLIANHLGYLDPLVVLKLTPCLPIAKFEVAGWPLLGAAASRLGVLFVR